MLTVAPDAVWPLSNLKLLEELKATVLLEGTSACCHFPYPSPAWSAPSRSSRDRTSMANPDETRLSVLDRFMVKAKKDPLVPVGALATVGFLLSGKNSRVPKRIETQSETLFARVEAC